MLLTCGVGEKLHDTEIVDVIVSETDTCDVYVADALSAPVDDGVGCRVSVLVLR